MSFSLSGFAVIPKGERIIKLKKTNETFVIEFPVANLRNILFGHKHIYYSGHLRVTNKNTGDEMTILYPKKGWTSKGDFLAHGKLIDKDKKVIYKFDGHWLKYGKLLNPENDELIKEWKT